MNLTTASRADSTPPQPVRTGIDFSVTDCVPIVGRVTAVKVRGDPISADTAGEYIASNAGDVTYDVLASTPEGIVQFRDASCLFPRPRAGYEVICHPVGLPVSGYRIGSTVYFQFAEQYNARECE